MVPVQSHVTRKQCKEDLNPGTVSSEPEGCSEDEVEVRNLGFTFRPVAENWAAWIWAGNMVCAEQGFRGAGDSEEGTYEVSECLTILPET